MEARRTLLEGRRTVESLKAERELYRAHPENPYLQGKEFFSIAVCLMRLLKDLPELAEDEGMDEFILWSKREIDLGDYALPV